MDSNGCRRARGLAAFSILALVPAIRVEPALAQQGTGASTTTGVSRAFNPAISVNGLFLGALDPGLGHQDAPGVIQEGLQLQEVEVQFTSTIDPYSKANAIAAYADGELSFEEAYISTSALPWSLGLQAGQMYIPFSNENVLHTHQLPFVQHSLVASFLGDEGLSDMGVELSYLLPTPFYTEVEASAFNGSDSRWFASSEGTDLAYCGRLAALWDLGESTTFRVTGGYLGGRNGYGDKTLSQIASGGLELKWRPTRMSIYRSLKVAAEYVYADRQADRGADPDLDPGVPPRFWVGGPYGYAQYQFGRRWWIQARYDQADPSDAAVSRRVSGLLAFVPSEFQALRLQVSSVSTPVDDYAEVILQYNFTIGSHPAHRY